MRLGVDSVDLWQLHGWDERVPMEEVLSAVDAAVASGRARYAGVSNLPGWRTAAAAAWQRAWPGRAPLAATQVEYSLLERGVEREVLPACGWAGLGVLAYSPLGRGVLTGKYRHGVAVRLPGRLAAPARLRRPPPRPTRRPGSWRRSRPRPRASAPRRWRSRWPGCGTGPGSARRSSAPATGGQLPGSLAADATVLPAEIRHALDDVSAPPAGYPEQYVEGAGTAGSGAGWPGRRCAAAARRRRRVRRVADPVFAAFCADGLWPGLGRTLAEALPAAGITAPGAT